MPGTPIGVPDTGAAFAPGNGSATGAPGGGGGVPGRPRCAGTPAGALAAGGKPYEPAAAAPSCGNP